MQIERPDQNHLFNLGVLGISFTMLNTRSQNKTSPEGNPRFLEQMSHYTSNQVGQYL